MSPPAGPRPRRRFGCWLLLVSGVVLAGAGLSWWWHPEVDLRAWEAGPVPQSWATWQRQEEVWKQQGLQRRPEHSYLPLQDISAELALAVLVSEDISFFGHGAIDPRAVWEVLHEWRTEGRLRGASTISQQVARMLFLTNERTFWRKVREARLAFCLDRRLGKRRVLEIYLNVVEFGPGLFGAEAASRHYLGISAANLTGEQAADIAAAIPAPGRDNCATRTAKWAYRRGVILRRLSRVGWLRSQLGRYRDRGTESGADRRSR